MEATNAPHLTPAQQFQLISRVSTEGLLIHEQGAIRYANRALADLLGYREEQLIGMDVFDLVAPEHRDRAHRMAETNEGHYRADLLHRDGTSMPASVAARIAEVDGRVYRVAVFRDLRALVASEEENERLRAIVETSPDFIGMAASDGTALYINPAGLRMCGYDSWEGLSVQGLQPEMPPEVIQEASERGHWVGESSIMTRDGRKIPVAGVITAVKDDDGNLRAITNISRDVTEQKELEEQIAEQNRVMMEMSTPVIKLWDRIVLMPLIGVIDTGRAAQMIEALLQAIVSEEATVAVLDVTGVPVIDTSVARHLLKTIDASAMLGAHVVVTGFSPHAAQTLAQLGVDFSNMRTTGTLRAGIEQAFRLVGASVNGNGHVVERMVR